MHCTSDQAVLVLVTFKLSTKKLVTALKCKPKPTAKDMITTINEITNNEGMLDRIQFHNIHHKSILSDIYANEVVYEDDNGYASNKYLMNEVKHEGDLNLISNINIGEDKLEGIDDMVEDDELHINDGIANDENQFNHFGPDQHEDEQNHFSAN